MATYRQHEPLRTPAGWTEQERALIVQLERLLDDLYNRRVKFIHLDDALQARITSGETSIEDLQEAVADNTNDIEDLQETTLTRGTVTWGDLINT